MIMQKKLSRGKLLNTRGELINYGYNTSLVADYKRSDIKGKKCRIKEWDYYLIYNSNNAIALTIADNSYMGLIAVSLIDFEKKTQTNEQVISFFTCGKTKMPSTSKFGDIIIENKILNLSFINNGKSRKIALAWNGYNKNKNLIANLELTNEPHDSMTIAIPFKESKRMFYYNQKIVGMKANGVVKFGEEEINFEKEDSVAIFDWGRGVWPYKNLWYWGAASGIVDNKQFGFNIGYGFGDTSHATENMIFYNGWSHKLDSIEIQIQKDEEGKEDYLKQWKITSNDKRFEMTFDPIINRIAKTSVIVLSSEQNQVFGKFNGKAVLDDGRVLEIKDLMGFVEKVKNKW